ncbi:helix-turn-helix domain-containing protein [Rhodococcus pyridinivorans]|uniref:helix-turn-helix domain-containing protein n=1 Tax=Rhodococcus pyridinivorans TaxID=103816 RepID=UPI001E614209|nr:helix-turn-helix domain-containing protein [Rhodococcus pyridinivorans]UGQ59884.1 helix-turn-helix domain-containing protein [Rhodococcus pyridinivorans]
MTASPWMTTKEAAEYARVNPHTIYDALRAGELKGHQINGKASNPWLMTAESIDAWIRGEKPGVSKSPESNRPRQETLAPVRSKSGQSDLRSKLLLNALEAAELLGVSDTTIRELWGAGHLRFVRIGKGRKVTRAELERFITERERSCE